MNRLRLLGLPVAAGSLAGAVVALGQPTDLQAALDALWGMTLLAMAGLGILAPEWLLHPEHERPGDLHPAERSASDVVKPCLAFVAGGMVCGSAVALGVPDPAALVPLLLYGALCGLAAAAVAISATVVAPASALDLWERGSAGRQLATALLQTPILSALSVGVAGLLLLIGALALMEPERLIGGWQSSQPIPRSTWVGLTVCAAPLFAAAATSLRSWARDARRYRIVTRTARMMLGSASGRSVSFDPVAHSDSRQVLELVVVATLDRRLPPVRGILTVLGIVCLLIGMAASRGAVDRAVALLPLVWAVSLARWPARADTIVDEVLRMSRLHPSSVVETPESLGRHARRWLVSRLFPGVLIPLPVLEWGSAAGAFGILLAVMTALFMIPSGRAPGRWLAFALFVGVLTWNVLPLLNPW